MPEHRDEVDLAELLDAAIDARTSMIVVVVVVSLLFWGGVATRALVSPPVLIYESRIDLTFRGADDGQYPNGEPFRITDIVAPVVLNRVYDEQQLASSIDRDTFINAVTASPYTPARHLILQKYDLNASGLTQVEISELEARLGTELAQAAKKSVAIRFASNSGESIPPERMAAALRAIPVEWNRHRVIDLGAAKYSEPMFSRAVVNRTLIESIDYLLAFEMILGRLDMLRENLDAIEAQPNGLLVADPQTNVSVTDLRRAIQDVEDYQLTPLMSPVRSLGIARDMPVVQLYFKNLLESTVRDKEVLTQRLSNIRSTYTDYVATQESAISDTRGTATSGTMIPQIGSEFLDRIIEMTNAGADIAYRQELNSRQLDLADQIANQDSEIDRITKTLEVLSSASAEDQPQSLKQTYTQALVEQLPVILSVIENHFDASNRMMLKLSVDQLGSDELLYKQSDGDVDIRREGSVLSVRNAEYFLISLILAVLLAMSASMLGRWRRRRANAEPSQEATT